MTIPNPLPSGYILPYGVSIVDGVMIIRQGTVTITDGGGGVWLLTINGNEYVIPADVASTVASIVLAKHVYLNIDADQLAGAATDGVTVDGKGYVNITGLSFIEASAVGAPHVTFEPNKNLNTFMDDYLGTHSIPWIIEHLQVNGTTADTFKLVWDVLDDRYVTEPYINPQTNESFVRLGAEYVAYLNAGGLALSDVVVKATDLGLIDAGGRGQSMHDNLLGNLTAASINDRFSSDPELVAELLALIPNDIETRPYYDGNAITSEAAHAAVREFDAAHGWYRPDYVTNDSDGTLSALAHDASGNIFAGIGNSADNYVIESNAAFDIELGLKVHYRTGDTVLPSFVDDATGVAHFTVDSGTQDGRHNENGVNVNRAAWNFDYSALVDDELGNLDDFSIKLLLDTDKSAAVNYVDLFSFDPIAGHQIEEYLAQDSFNLAFASSIIDIDPDAEGIQPYTFGEGQFDVTLAAYSPEGTQLASAHIVVHVSDDWLTAPTPVV